MFRNVTASTGGNASTVVIGVADSLQLTSSAQARSNDAVRAAIDHPSFKGSPGTIGEAISGDMRYFILGLGKGEQPCTCFQNAGKLGRRLAQAHVESAEVLIEGCDWESFGCGFAVLCWDYSKLRGTGTKEKHKGDLELVLPSQDAVEAFNRGLALGKSVNLCRDLSQTPPNIATPMWIAGEAEKMAAETGLTCQVVKGDQLEEEDLQGLINVGKASENKPCLIRLEYNPEGATGKPIVLLGKTMTYDTGGLSLKISGSMVGMKRDKDGGCAVFGAMHAIATVFKPNRRVIGLLVAAENSISDEAYRPDDVITYRNGVTVEVTNTDAEGRLVLADGLCWACDKEDPECIVDIATLTGGVVTALGKVYAGFFSDSEDLIEKLEIAADETGDRIWRLPLHEEYRDLMKSPVADILNSNPNRQAHPIQGAAFLSYFVKDEVPWAHIDIAGVHAVEKDSGPFIAGPTGYGVRLLAKFASQ